MTAPGQYMVETTIEQAVYQITTTAPDVYELDTTIQQTTYQVAAVDVPVPGQRGPSGIDWRLEWQPDLQYFTDDGVFWLGSSWRAVIDNIGVAPDTDDGTHWELLAAQGAPGQIQSVTAADGTVVVAGTSTAPTLKANVGTAAGTVAAGNHTHAPVPPAGTAGGDLTGTYPNPGVGKIAGVAVSGTPTAGQVLTATSGTAAAWQPPPGWTPPAPTWTTPTLTSGSVPAGEQAPRYTKDALGKIRIEGTVTGISTGGATLFTLPTGYRPAAPLYVPCGNKSGGGTGGNATITTAGVVSAASSSGTGAVLGFAIEFYPA